MRRIISFRGYGIPTEDRRDLKQEVLAQLWSATSRRGFDPDAGFWAFIDVVATRRCIDWRRTARRVEPIEAARTDEGHGPLQRILAQERADLAHAALARLGRACRELVYLHAGLGQTYAEIARLTGRREGALRVQMHRCIRSARDVLAQLVADTAQT